jgi:hypothetical protein
VAFPRACACVRVRKKGPLYLALAKARFCRRFILITRSASARASSQLGARLSEASDPPCASER